MQPPFQLDFFNPPFRSASPQKTPIRAVPAWKYKAIVFASQIMKNCGILLVLMPGIAIEAKDWQTFAVRGGSARQGDGYILRNAGKSSV